MKYFIKQLGDKDCGFTCVKMLLAIMYKKTDFLYYPEPSISNSASLREIMMFAKKEGITLGGYRLLDKTKIQSISKYPVLIPITRDEKIHMVLVKKIYKKSCVIYDPAIGVYRIKLDKLNSFWNGEYLQILNCLGSNFSLKKMRIIPRIMTLTTMVFEILSFASLIIALYFLDGSVSFYFSLGLFASYIICEFIYRKMLIQSMKYFDNHTMIDQFALNRQDFKNRYANMTQFKVLSISNPIQLLSLILMTSFGIVVLGINSPFNLLSIAIILIFLFIFKIFEKYTYDHKRNLVDVLEKDLSSVSRLENNVFLDKIKALNNETYSYVSFCNFKRYLMFFLIIALSLLYVTLSKVNSLNFMLFHFFFYLYLSENFEKIMNFGKNFEEYKHYKALYLYYFDRY